jgi:membrane peptidoglycan carboxypeptidase
VLHSVAKKVRASNERKILDIYRQRYGAMLRNPTQNMQFDNYRPRPSTPKPTSHIGLLLVIFMLALALLIALEVKTSFYQAKFLHQYANSLTYRLQTGATTEVVYPQYGPFDERHGYVQLPQFLQRLQRRNFSIVEQSTFSPPMMQYARWGFFPPYHEKARTGLELMDCRNEELFSFVYPRRVYQSADEIPVEVVNTLLFIENRELWTSEPKLNPVIDWPRFIVAGMSQIAEKLGMNVSTAGGSTLATQIEKFRHSAHGLTLSIKDKLLQIGSASIRVYQQGELTEPARRRVVLDYLNTVPLSSAPGYGEVHGIGDGLWAWFGTEFGEANRIFGAPSTKENLQRRGQIFRQVVALMIAQRRPSYYLLQGHADLESLIDSHIRLLARHRLIDGSLKDAAMAQKLAFRYKKVEKQLHSAADKGINAARIRTAGMLNTSLYDLDRLDLKVYSTLHGDLQQQVSDYINSLAQISTAERIGLLGERLLEREQVDKVVYSFTLYERTGEANKVRVQTDSTDQPFDINEGSKLELGSTAKLRVLSTYLEIVTELYQRLVPMGRSALMTLDVEEKDHITQWLVDYLLTAQDKSLRATLHAALERRYSASPYERFFTGGGQHVFNNFKREENGKSPTLYQALQDSINLPFVRLMRDIVSYSSSYQNEGSIAQLLRNDKDPRREEYLRAFAAREGSVFVNRFYRKYKNVDPAQRLDVLFDGLTQVEHRLAPAYRYLLPDESLVSFRHFLNGRLPETGLSEKKIAELYGKYGPDKFNLPDQGFIARTHPLELWVLSYLLHKPDASLSEVREASQPRLQEVYRWLFRTRHKNARDVRVRVMLEVEAFLDIHQRWQKVGYPFEHMVPSLASALGSSGDRPAALAELMGIIQNDGVRMPTMRLSQLHFAQNTPYEVKLLSGSKLTGTQGERVMHPEVARALRQALTNVVDQGTGRRLKGIYKDGQGNMLAIGGKTGTGDNRIVTMRHGVKIAGTTLNRTATFVFYLGDNFFGTLTAFVPGSKADDFSFTSSLPLQVMKGMMPILSPYVQPDKQICTLVQ